MSTINSKLSTLDFSKICRICLNPGDLILLSEHTISILNSIANVEINILDGLPQNTCNNCINQLQIISTFIDTFKVNDELLRKILAEHTEGFKLEEQDSEFNELDDNSSSHVEDVINTESENKTQLNDSSPEQNQCLKKENKVQAPRVKNIDLDKYSCNTCGKTFLRWSGLTRHSKIHLGIKPYKCLTCNKTFIQRATLNRHYLTHTGEKPFECNLCGKVTRRKDQIIEHIQKHHPNVKDFNFVINKQNIKDAIVEENNLNKKSEDNSNQPTITEDYETEDEIKRFKTKKRIEICLCNLCGKVFRRRGYLKNHMAIHANIKPFQCNICGKGFTQRHALIRHNLVHTKERPFQCNLCGKTFTRKEILVEHIKNHDGSKPYLCFHCGKCFTNKDYLAKHLKYHLSGKKNRTNSEEKKCICPHCGKQLHSISYLKTHLLTHTGEKPYECDICGNKFTVQRSLNHHLNIHRGIKPYKCNQCEKSFRTSSSLRKHEFLHTGERPYKCTNCNKGFIRRSHLKRHFRTH